MPSPMARLPEPSRRSTTPSRRDRTSSFIQQPLPTNPTIRDLQEFCRTNKIAFQSTREALGDALGRIAATLIETRALRRVIVAGGDTSGRVLARLPIDVLEATAPLASGSPLCRAYSEAPAFDGLELALKGGQVGGADLFVKATGRCSE